ncbi:Ig-like domain-containing protein [Fredinandcohnia sp. 179-A 10B2 NHS]|uniref:Ig-like domain-containing protein n=1 Tax=Fredinandcohnia sp. 179-A 10B2 NHS TaxID=3235176 RepID=UPI0039A2AA64
MQKIIIILLALQLLLIPTLSYAAEMTEKTPVIEKRISASIIEGTVQKSITQDINYSDPRYYPLVSKGSLASVLTDSYGGTQEIYYIDLYEISQERMELELLYLSEYKDQKDSVLTIEFFLENDSLLEYMGSTDLHTDGYDGAYFQIPLLKNIDQQYIYMLVGTSQSVSDPVYSSVSTFKVLNPFYVEGNPSAENFVLISNESTDAETTESTGTFSFIEQTKNIEMNPSLDQSTYQMDMNLPFDIPKTKDKLVNQSQFFAAQTFLVGDYKKFWVTNLSDDSNYQIDARLAYNGSKSQVWVHQGEITDADAAKLGKEFDERIYDSVTSHFAPESDVDRNGKVNILVFDIQDGYNGYGGYTGGYFWGGDLYSSSYVYSSNQSEIFYIDTYPTMGEKNASKDVTRAYGTIAHEFQHMVNFNRNVLIEGSTSNMPSWMNEGLSEAANQIYQGQGLWGRLYYYNQSTTIQNGHSLLKWGDNGDSLANYSLSYLFMQYLKIQANQGEAIFKEILEDRNNDYQAIENVARKYIDPTITFGELMTNFRMALFLNEPTGLYGFGGDPFFEDLKQRIYTGGPTNLRGGGAIVFASDSETVPANKGANITYRFIKNQSDEGGSSDVTPPHSPNVIPISNLDTTITGIAEPSSTVYAKVGTTEIGRTSSDTKGQFTISISVQEAGTIVEVYAEDAAGNVSEPSLLTVYDVIAPESPIVNEVTDKDTAVTGRAEAGATIRVIYNNSIIGTDKANSSGTFTVAIPQQQAGNALWVSALDNNGNQSNATLVIVKGTVSVTKPEVFEITDQDNTVTGKADPGVTLQVDANGLYLTTGYAEIDGTFSIPIPVPMAGTEITVTAFDSKGNSSEPTTVYVKDVTTPGKPVVHEVTDQDSIISGEAEPGSTVEVRVNGAIIGQDVVSSMGIFSFYIPSQVAGTNLRVTATDEAGNVSEAVNVVVKDITAPEKPVVNDVTDQEKTVTGFAEAGSEVEVRVNGTTIGSGQTSLNGSFTITIPIQKAGVTLSITSIDAADNRSEVTTVLVKDATPPVNPVVQEVTEESTTVNGQAEVGSTIEVSVTGNVIGTGKAGTDGNFSVTILSQPAGTVLAVTAKDTVGNVSESTHVTVKNVNKAGWALENNKWYFYDGTTGVKKVGWLLDAGTWYYLDKDGAMKTGWFQEGTTWYYLAKSGAMQKGWVTVSGQWYYMNASGKMQTGWNQSAGKWYYLSNSGEMKTGWVTVGGYWYYMNGSGEMQTGWLKQGSSWYYLTSSGTMKTGWLQLGSTWYYMDKNGVMKTNWVLIGNKWYFFNSSGVWIQ